MWIITGPFDEDHSEGQAPDSMRIFSFHHAHSHLPQSKSFSRLAKNMALAGETKPFRSKARLSQNFMPFSSSAPAQMKRPYATPPLLLSPTSDSSSLAGRSRLHSNSDISEHHRSYAPNRTTISIPSSRHMPTQEQHAIGERRYRSSLG